MDGRGEIDPVTHAEGEKVDVYCLKVQRVVFCAIRGQKNAHLYRYHRGEREGGRMRVVKELRIRGIFFHITLFSHVCILIYDSSYK
jgi:hypothetical protein